MSRDARVDAYLDAAAPFAQAVLGHVRERIHALVPDAAEDIKWSMPAFLAGGRIAVVLAAFKAHCAVNFPGDKPEGAAGMGKLGKLTAIADLPADLDQQILAAAAAARAGPTMRRADKAPRPAPVMHPDFAAALDAAPPAKANFDGFPPGQRKEYVAWIAEAKQDATRARRIAQAIEWLGEGKRRNWKYEGC